MEVILLEKVNNLGDLGDKVNVKSGYGRNFLIPQEKAVPATAKHLEEFEARRAELEKAEKEALSKAQAREKALSELSVTISRNAGAEGKLFGSVTSADIAAAASEAGVELEKREVRLPDGPLHEIGEFDIDLHLHSDVNTTVKVNVVAEES
ncbi:MAG: 50S ribosomal protein L9 [Gammaproteobacteria bacterium]